MKQFKILIAFIFLFTQNVYASSFDDFGNPTESAASGDGTPKCSKTIEEVSSELSQIQVGSEKDISKLNAAQRKASELSGVASCLSVESDAGKALKADVDSASTNINNQINAVYNLVVEEEKEKSKSDTASDSAREAKKFAEVKPSETLPSKPAFTAPQPSVANPTSGSASVPVAVAPDAATKKTDSQLPTTSPSETPTVVPAKPVAASAFEPSSITKDSSTQMGPPAPAGSSVKDGQTIVSKEDPPVTQSKPVAPVVTADPTKKITDVATAATPVKPAASSDINIGTIAKIGLMAAAAWIYVKELTKAFKKKDEDTSANRSTASSGSGSSSSSSNPSGTKAVAGGKGCTGTFVGTIDAPSHAERIKARNIKLNNMGYQLTGNDYEDNGATGGGGVDGGMYLTGSFSFETDANCKVISGQAIIFGSPFDISGTVNQNRTFNLSYLGPMPGVITADNKISGKLQHGGGEEYIHGVLNGRFTPKK